MIDVARESVLRLTEAARMLPGAAGREHVHIQTLRRWAVAGLRGVRLETAWSGGQRVTTREALARFVAALTSARQRDDDCARDVLSRGERILRARQRLAIEHGLS